MNRILICLLAIGSFGCAGNLTADQCKGYATLAKVIALELASDIDPASPKGKELRERWAEIGKLAAQAGCEQWAQVEVTP